MVRKATSVPNIHNVSISLSLIRSSSSWFSFSVHVKLLYHIISYYFWSQSEWLILLWLTEFYLIYRRHHYWHAPPGVSSTKHRHQSPGWTILSHVSCFIQGEVVGYQVLLDSLHPRTMRASWWSPPGLQEGSFVWAGLTSADHGFIVCQLNRSCRQLLMICFSLVC